MPSLVDSAINISLMCGVMAVTKELSLIFNKVKCCCVVSFKKLGAAEREYFLILVRQNEGLFQLAFEILKFVCFGQPLRRNRTIFPLSFKYK